MGYTITIGELETQAYPNDGLDCSCIRFDATGVRHDAAPAFGEPTDYTNSRWPSYGVWHEFMRSVGLGDVFFTEDGHLIGGHPGVRLVTREMVEAVASALAAYRAKHPALQAVLSDNDKDSGWLCRLIWLDYWLRWSIDNCKTPVIANS